MQTEINFGPDPQPTPRQPTGADSYATHSIEELLQSCDLTKTSLGPVEEWPQNMQFLFRLCRNAQNAMAFFWGEELWVFFNTTWNHFFGTAFEFGRPAAESLEGEWKVAAEEAMQQVLATGEAVRVNNFYWTPDAQDCCYDLTFNPIMDDNGKETIGVMVVAIDVTDRVEAQGLKKRVEEALKIDTVAIDFFTMEGEILRANEGFLKMTGYSRRDLEEGNVRWDEMTPPEHSGVTQKALRELQEKGWTEPYEKEYYRKDGSRWWGLFSSQALEDGTAIEFVVDITERKRSELKYRTLFNSIDEAFCILQIEFDDQDTPMDYRYLEVNPAFKQLTGLSGIEGESTRQLLPDHEEYWFERYGEVAINRDPVRFEEYAREFDRYYDVFAFPFGDPEEHKIAVLFDDITERKKASEEREEIMRKIETERQRLLDIFQHAPSFMCILRGPDHVFERVNEQYYKLIGDRELVGKTVAEALPELNGNRFIEELDQVYETGETYRGRGTKIKIKRQAKQPAEERYVDFVFQPYRDADGSINGIFVQGVDLTDRIKAEKELKSVNEHLEERVRERTASLLSYQDQLRSLASQLSRAEEQERQRLAAELHDNLGQMLAVSKMKVDLLRKGKLADETASDVEGLRDLIQDALLYTRELMSDLKPPPTLDQEGFKASMEWLANKMEKHDLKVILEDDNKPIRVEEDIRTVLVQCVRELLFNIIKHAGVDKAFIRLERVDSELKIEVEDKGRGFDPEADRADATEGGFGLFNISERIDLLGGSMRIHSKPGEGTIVEVRVPVKQGEQQEERPEEEKIETPAQSGELPRIVKVLLVDDHEMMREGLRKIVNEEDDLKVVAEASDGKEALKKAKEVAPDVVVMDVNMPRMDGIEATQRLQEEMPTVRVVALSLHDHQNVIDSMRSAGATAYLTKNEAFETLCATIRSEAAMLRE